MKDLNDQSFKLKLLLSFALSFVFCLLIMLISPLQYDTNDDYGIMLAFNGYMSGSPSYYSPFFSSVLGAPLSLLYTLIPSVQWYTFAHFSVIFLSLWVAAYCLIPYCLKNTVYSFVSVIIVLQLFFVAFAEPLYLLQFTTTSGFASGAACLLFLRYTGNSRKSFIFNLIMITSLLCLSFGFRSQAVLPGIMFIIFLAVWKVIFEKKLPIKRVLTLLLVPLLSVVIMQTIQWTISQKPEIAKFERYNVARGEFMGYYALPYSKIPEVYAAAGLSETQAELILNWCFMFDEVNTETFESLNNSASKLVEKKSVSQRLEVVDVLLDRISSDQYFDRTISISIIFSIFTLLILLYNQIFPSGKRSFLAFITAFLPPLAAIGMLFALIFYFCYTGRFPIRVHRMLILTFLPCISFIFLQALEQPELIKVKEAFTKSKALHLTSILFVIVIIMQTNLSAHLSNVSTKIPTGALLSIDINEYCIQNSENIYIYDGSLSDINARPFGTYVEKKHTNLFFWGGWGMFSPDFYKQLEVNGLENLNMDVLLKDNVYMLVEKNIDQYMVEYCHSKFPDYKFVKTDSIQSYQDTVVSVFKLTHI